MSAKIHPLRFEKPRDDDSQDGSLNGPADSSLNRPAEIDPRVREVLIHLPRERAGDAFTVQVLERAGATTTRHRRLRSLAAAAAFFAVGAIGAREWGQNLAQEAAAERIASLRVEYQLLQEELHELEREADEKRPVVYLGGDSDVEYVLDLSRLPANRPAVNRSAMTRPAINRPSNRRDIRPASAAAF